MSQLITLTEEALATHNLTSNEKLMLGRIASFNNGCPMRLDDFVAELGISKTIAMKGIKHLKEKNYIDEGKYGNYFPKILG
jgi:Mn-dependent DtxR family transcriptional regulator